MCIRFLGSIGIVKGLCEENYTDRNMQLAGVINYYLIFHPLVFPIKLIVDTKTRQHTRMR